MDDGIPTLDDVLRDTPSAGALKKKLGLLENTEDALTVPLGKTVTDRLQRKVAYENTSKEVSRWLPIVQKNRQAEHLSFPLNAPPKRNVTVASMTATAESVTEMEKQIQEVLKASNMAEPQVVEAEQLQFNKLDPDQLKEKQAQLSKVKALMFYAEIKSKRSKKIKSKKFRKVVKRQKEKQKAAALQRLQDEDPDAARELVEKEELKRIKERMTQKHANTSKWSRHALSREHQDDDTRQAISDQQRLRNELARKQRSIESESDSDHDDVQLLVSGPRSRASDVNPTESSDSEDSEGNSEDDRDSDDVSENDVSDDAAAKKKKEANVAKKSGKAKKQQQQQTDFAIPADIDLSGPRTGRRFKTDTNGTTAEPVSLPQSVTAVISQAIAATPTPTTTTSTTATVTASSTAASAPEVNPWLVPARQRKTKRAADDEDQQPAKQPKSEATTTAAGATDEASAKGKQRNKRKRAQQLAVDEQTAFAEDDDSDNGEHMSKQQLELLQRAFAGDDVVAEFKTDKKRVVDDGMPVVQDTFLPGWGSWTGEGARQPRNRPKRKQPVAPLRADDKLPAVILNEKRDKKIVKHLADHVPYPFKSREEYERTLRVPLAPETNTIGIHRKMIQPRVSVKKGAVIAPIKYSKQVKRKREPASAAKKQ
eukprot:TRINITY_DN7750_c0_g1_i1.p1 TRINITY_DN7750_c0_g1~~TRINITY_DN7750_c0_g1_i1.p1  ORF type:complete len:653 (+),score=191.32 TRINITY_DN7750_c0_g1_i1:64-2022(+)